MTTHVSICLRVIKSLRPTYYPLTCRLSLAGIDLIMVNGILRDSEIVGDGPSIRQREWDKNIYQLTREGLKLSREAASELLESIPPERIAKN